MKLCAKKVYCRNCQKLVRVREQQVNDNIGIICLRCGELVCLWNGVTWRYPPKYAK